MISEKRRLHLQKLINARKGLKFSDEVKKRMREAQRKYFKTHSGNRKGVKLSEETKKKISEARIREKKWVGEDCPNWKGGVTKESEKQRKMGRYRRWRKQVFERDGYTCQLCGQHGGELETHHKKSFINYKELRISIDNGITLCKECHKNVERLKREEQKCSQ